MHNHTVISTTLIDPQSNNSAFSKLSLISSPKALIFTIGDPNRLQTLSAHFEDISSTHPHDISAYITPRSVAISLKGHSTHVDADDEGEVILIEHYEGTVKAHLWEDINREDATTSLQLTKNDAVALYFSNTKQCMVLRYFKDDLDAQGESSVAYELSHAKNGSRID